MRSQERTVIALIAICSTSATMHRAPAGRLLDLLATTEAVGHDQRPAAAARTAGSSTRSPIACDTSYLPASKPNAPAMPQQPESSDCSSEPHLPQQRLLMAHLHQRLLMAVPVEQHLPVESGG